MEMDNEEQKINEEPVVTKSSPEGGAPHRLERNLKKAMVGGVLAGFTDYLTSPIDVTIVRLFFVFVSIWAFPVAPIVYFIAWLVMPLAEESKGLDGDKTEKIFKFGCLGCLGSMLFPLLVIGVLLVIPLGYVSDFAQILADDPNLFFCDDLSIDVQYHPNIPMLTTGVALAVLFPIFSLMLLSGKKELLGLSKRTAYICIALVALMGVMVAVSAVTAG